jgi:dTDP-glucose 4,6-dehydratase
VDAAHAQRELGWAPRATFESGLEATVNWYLENAHWWQGAMQGRYDGGRLGLAG